MANGLDRYAVFSEDGDRLLAIGKTWRRRCSARRVNAAARSAPVADKRAAVERARKEAEAKRIRRTAQPVAASWIAGLLWNSVFSFPLPSFVKLSLRHRPRTTGVFR